MVSQEQDEATTHLSERAYRHILSDILSARLPAGAPIQERRIAAEIGLSRSPLRDALGRLAGEGLLVRGNTGALKVRAISLQDYLQSLDMRALVEPSAAALAAGAIEAEDLERLKTAFEKLGRLENPERDELVAFDDDLHGTLAARSGNPFMQRVLTEMRRYTTIYERQAGRRPPSNFDRAEHQAILDGLLANAPARTGEAMRHHIAAIRQRVLEQF